MQNDEALDDASVRIAFKDSKLSNGLNYKTNVEVTNLDAINAQDIFVNYVLINPDGIISDLVIR